MSYDPARVIYHVYIDGSEIGQLEPAIQRGGDLTHLKAPYRSNHVIIILYPTTYTIIGMILCILQMLRSLDEIVINEYKKGVTVFTHTT